MANQRTPKVHFWFGGTGKKGHLLLIPIATSATEPVLGVLAVDTLRKSQASHTSVNFDQVCVELRRISTGRENQGGIHAGEMTRRKGG